MLGLADGDVQDKLLIYQMQASLEHHSIDVTRGYNIERIFQGWFYLL
jgi:hypothetical protein